MSPFSPFGLALGLLGTVLVGLLLNDVKASSVPSWLQNGSDWYSPHDGSAAPTRVGVAVPSALNTTLLSHSRDCDMLTSMSLVGPHAFSVANDSMRNIFQ